MKVELIDCFVIIEHLIFGDITLEVFLSGKVMMVNYCHDGNMIAALDDMDDVQIIETDKILRPKVIIDE